MRRYFKRTEGNSRRNRFLIRKLNHNTYFSTGTFPFVYWMPHKFSWFPRKPYGWKRRALHFASWNCWSVRIIALLHSLRQSRAHEVKTMNIGLDVRQSRNISISKLDRFSKIKRFLKENKYPITLQGSVTKYFCLELISHKENVFIPIKKKINI